MGAWALVKRVGCIEFIWAKGWIRLDARLLSAVVIGMSIYLKPITCGRKLVETKMGKQNLKKYKIRG